MPFTSGIIGGYLSAENLYPNITFYTWNVDEFVSPIGQRNLESGSFAFNKTVGLHLSRPLEFRGLIKDFSNISGHYQSLTECVLFRQTNDRFNISNIKFWMPSGTALSGCNLEYVKSGNWLYDYHIPSGAGTAVPSSLPTYSNLSRQDGLYFIDGADDIHVSEFIYLVLTIPSGLPIGRYGPSNANGNLAFKATYDFWQIV